MGLAYQEMDQGHFDRALGKLSEAESYAPPGPALSAEIAFLRAQCVDRMGRVDEAIGAYSHTAEKYPDSIYGRQALSRLAQLRSPSRPSASPPLIDPYDLYPEVEHLRTDDGSLPPNRTLPRLAFSLAPDYSKIVASGHVRMEITVAFLVMKDGSIYHPKIVHCPDARFAEPTLRALQQWKFEPGRVDGRVVNMMCVQSFSVVQ